MSASRSARSTSADTKKARRLVKKFFTTRTKGESFTVENIVSVLVRENHLESDTVQKAIMHFSTTSDLKVRTVEGRGLCAQWRHEDEKADFQALQVKMEGLDSMHVAAYQIIESRGNTGIFVNDLKYKLQLNYRQKHFKKIMAELINRNLVAEIRPLGEPSKVHYILKSLKPARLISGGPLYSEGTLDTGLLECLEKFLLKMTKRSKGQGMTANSVLKALDEKEREGQKLFATKFSASDIIQVLDKLSYDDKLQIGGAVSASGETTASTPFYLKKDEFSFANFVKTPCGRCPVFDQCTPGGNVSPETCEYISKWLDF